VVGTWTILSQPTTIYRTVELGGPETGKVSVNIEPPTEPVLADEGGKVSVKILKG
jgi:hypothetical protein